MNFELLCMFKEKLKVTPLQLRFLDPMVDENLEAYLLIRFNGVSRKSQERLALEKLFFIEGSKVYNFTGILAKLQIIL